MKFIDETSLYLESGRGGPGCVSFHREKYLPRGGPDGGDGGRGGHVIFRVNPRLNSLIDLYSRRKMIAQNGRPGNSKNMTGADGDDLVIDVPPGTIVRDEETVYADLSEGDWTFLKGGRGGKGNTFYKTSINQAPNRAQPGEEGEGREVTLELKLIADIGLVGFPNAGKSTFISRVSAAKPKIADYPFTTLTPNLGVVSVGEGDSFVVADIPGLIPDAHQGVGLGSQFLRHIERTKAFVHVIDASGMTGRDPWEDYEQINHELKMHNEELMQRKQIVVLNKTDVLSQEQKEDVYLKFFKNDVEALMISAVTGDGMNKVIEKMSVEALKMGEPNV